MWRALLLPCLLTAGLFASQPVDYYPLAKGARWEYVVTQPGKPGAGRRVVYRVTDRIDLSGEATYQVAVDDPAVRSDEPLEFTVRQNGDIVCDKCDAYLLKSPLAVGAKWESSETGAPEQSRIVSVDAGCGRYQRCLVVETTGGGTGARRVTTYAHGIGPVQVEYYRGGKMIRRETLTGSPR